LARRAGDWKLKPLSVRVHDSRKFSSFIKRGDLASPVTRYYHKGLVWYYPEVPMNTMSIKLSPRLSAKLSRAAKKRGQSKSEIVRTALELFLNGNGTIRPGSALEAVLPWVGCVEGPDDLATNPKYMEGFGK
jgi:hypothetical protein